jgi:Zn-dependent protease with chaperone function
MPWLDRGPGFPGLVRREHTHRRVLLLGLSSLMLLSVVPTIGHHVPGGLGEPFARVEHLGAFCAAALRGLLSPLHGIFHLALLAGGIYGLVDRLLAWRSVRQVLNSLESDSPEPESPFLYAARAAHIDARRISVIEGLPNPAFTAGIWSPRIFIAASLACRLTQAELNAVIGHEAAHVRRRDPLRLSTYRFLSCLFFWLPALKELAGDMADEAEIEADDAAAETGPLALASALLKLAADPRGSLPAHSLVGFANGDLLDRRIRRLTGDSTALPTRVTGRSLLLAGIALTFVLMSGMAAAQGPSAHSGEAISNHCDHHNGGFLSHLWCSVDDCHGASVHCDHAPRRQ